jgi:hypothetical protein
MQPRVGPFLGRQNRKDLLVEQEIDAATLVPITSRFSHKGSIISARLVKPRQTETQPYRQPPLGVATAVNGRAATLPL